MDTIFNVGTWQGKVVATTATVAGVYGLYLVARKPKRASKEMDLEKLISILEGFAQSVEDAAQAIAKQEKMVRQRMKMTGRSVSDEEMMMYCQQEFEQAIMQREAAIYEKFKTTEQASKRAWERYRNNETVAKLESRILTCASAFEPKEVELPSEDELLAMLSDLVDGTSQATETIVADLAKRQITPQSPTFLPLFQRQFQQKTQKIEAEVLAKHKMTESSYNSAVMQYQESPKFIAALALRKEKQQRAFEAAGLKL